MHDLLRARVTYGTSTINHPKQSIVLTRRAAQDEKMEDLMRGADEVERPWTE